jgi:hypothetical protein
VAAATKDITIERGATYQNTFALKNADDSSAFDLSGFTATAQARKSANSDSVVVEFDCDIPSPATDGVITISVDKGETLNLREGTYHWDLFIDDGTTATRLLKGRVQVVPTVTR